MIGLTTTTTSTIFIFASPQFLARHEDFRSALLVCNCRGISRSISIDEAHLFSQHGNSFRPEIRLLGEEFFKVLYAHGAPVSTFHIAFTATMALTDLSGLLSITYIGLLPASRFWASERQFDLSCSHIALRVGSDYTKQLDRAVTHLSKCKSSMFVFANSRQLTHDLVTSLEKKLDEK